MILVKSTPSLPPKWLWKPKVLIDIQCRQSAGSKFDSTATGTGEKLKLGQGGVCAKSQRKYLTEPESEHTPLQCPFHRNLLIEKWSHWHSILENTVISMYAQIRIAEIPLPASRLSHWSNGTPKRRTYRASIHLAKQKYLKAGRKWPTL